MKAIPANMKIESMEIITESSVKYKGQGGANGGDWLSVHEKILRWRFYNMNISLSGGIVNGN